MAKDLIFIRILQHDTEDEIRIGVSFPATDLDKAVQGCIDTYEVKTAWCGGFKAACENYYKRIALVDAETLKVIRQIYPNEEKEEK